MKRYPEEYEALIEALEYGPNPSSAEEVTGARFDLFSQVNNIQELNGINPQDINRSLGYIGGVVYVTGMTPKSNLGDEDKIGILQASADHLDRVGSYNKTGRSLVAATLKRVENQIFRNQDLTASAHGQCANLYDTRLLVIRNIPRRSAKEVLRTWADVGFDRAIDGETRQRLDQLLGVVTVMASQQDTMNGMRNTYGGLRLDTRLIRPGR
jgi:hypothetical protein